MGLMKFNILYFVHVYGSEEEISLGGSFPYHNKNGFSLILHCY